MSSAHDATDVASRDPAYELDPVYVSSRREALVVLAVFVVFAVYVLAVSFGLGSSPAPSDEQPVPTLWGMPRWVFHGILLPWLAANLVTGWFCFRFMRSDSLDESQDQTLPSEARHD